MLLFSFGLIYCISVYLINHANNLQPQMKSDVHVDTRVINVYRAQNFQNKILRDIKYEKLFV